MGGTSAGRLPGSRSQDRAARNIARNRAPALSDAEVAAWFAGKTFSTDWTSWNFPLWAKLLRRFRSAPVRVLEIGSWEGRSALFFVNYLPRAQLTCIDTFEGAAEHQADPYTVTHQLPAIECLFESNLAAFADRVEKIKAPSARALPELGIAGRRFEIAYIDGSHRAADVYGDGALTWPLIARGGIMIFDDYQWEMMPTPLDNPKPGIDAFLKAVKGQYRVVHRAYQIAVAKR